MTGHITITLQQVGDKAQDGRYQVIKLTNTIQYHIHEVLSAQDVQDLIESSDCTVNIIPKK
jgi:hypothetical protein